MGKKLMLFILSIISGLSFSMVHTKKLEISPASDISVKKVIEKYIGALGGEDLKEIKTVSKKGTLLRGSIGKVPFEMVSKSDGKWYYKQIFAYGDVVCYGMDGKKAWVQDTKQISQLSEEEKIDIQFIADIQMPFKILEVFPKISLKQTNKEYPSDSIKLIAVTDKGIERELIFDKNSGLLLGVGDILFEDYRQVGNIKLPHKIYIGDYKGGEIFRLKMEISEVKLKDEVDNSVFNQPLCPLKPEKSQLYTLRNQVVISDEAMNACVGTYQGIEDPTLMFYISKQGKYLMLSTIGSAKIEIKPVSELDFFVRFWNQEYHFIKDNTGKIVQLELGADRKIKARKIN